MSDILAIVEQADSDEQLVAQIALRHPDRVTVLVEYGSLEEGQAEGNPRAGVLSDRLARLLAAIEQRTGAVVVGLAGSREQLRGWRFDRIVSAHGPIAAL
jgi:D-serine deaminase-like pyridoxal phosphate-dependent protein